MRKFCVIILTLRFDKTAFIGYYKSMIIQGTIKDIKYRNNENGYTILEISQGMLNTFATGKFPIVGIGEEVELEGSYENNPKYGKQFVVTAFKINKPTSQESIIKYLSSGLISGVGIVTATSIVNMFGEKTLEVIEKEPQKLKQVRGVSERKALEIYQTYQDIKKMQQAVMFLQQYDITINMAVKIYEVYKDKTESTLKKNPYKLVEDVEGIGFKTADKIAFKMGIEQDSSFRMRAGVLYCLNEYAEKQGSTVILKDALAEMAVGLLKLPNEYMGDILGLITNLEIEGLLKSTTIEQESAVAISRLYNMENYIANKLKLLQNAVGDFYADFVSEISEFERINNLTLHETQRQAIIEAIKQGVAVITGGPGTGKTTIIKAILYILESHNLKTTLLAPTGRASKRMEEQTKRTASTIHRGLEMAYINGKLGFARNENNPLETDVIIVDEVSMLDIYVASALLKAVPLGTRVIFVGDKDQLMSVGAGNVLSDIIESEQVATIKLTQIFRQAEQSTIVLNAHIINDGEMPDLSAKSDDFFYSSSYIPEKVSQEIVDMVDTRIPKFNSSLQSQNIQVLVPMKAGETGANNLNLKLRERLNPPSSEKAEIEIHKTIFRVGDKVMQTANNYEQEWLKVENGLLTNGVGVFNGDMGYISQINTQSGEVRVDFDDGRTASYSLVELEDLVHAYAITIHKSQGSEFDAVIIPILGGNPMLYNKNLLYTAVTRAKKMVVLIGKRNNIYHMIKNEYLVKRNTMLKRFLQSNNNLLS